MKLPRTHPAKRATSLTWGVVVLMAVTATAAPPIRPHPDNPRWFEWRGRAVALITSTENYGAVLNLDSDIRRYLDTLRRGGMNYTRIFAGSYVEPPVAFGIERNTLPSGATLRLFEIKGVATSRAE
jgi:hypothetical protein